MEKQITIRSGGLELAATLHYPTNEGYGKADSRYPVIVLCHGFVGNRIGVNRIFVKAARRFSALGYMVVRFDYGGCGESTGDYGATGLDSMIEQTRHVLDYVTAHDCIDPERIILLGHSLGGAAAILTAAKDKRVRTLVLWAPVAHPFSDIVRICGKQVYEQSVAYGTADYLGYGLQPVFFESLSLHHPFQEIQKFAGDVLLVHGTADEVIPVDYSFLYQKVCWLRSDGQCDKEIIFQADHTFSAGDSIQQVIRTTETWLTEMERRKIEWNGWTI